MEITSGNSLNHWENTIIDSITILPKDRIPVHLNCDCKEQIYFEGWNPKCRVHECFFTEDYPLSSQTTWHIRGSDYIINDGFSVSVYLQGTRTIFRGGE